ncbi:MAG: CcmD family protein [Bacteroidetes bacterium]|nr:CcmD family protein [Bacteroidota bacterium]
MKKIKMLLFAMLAYVVSNAQGEAVEMADTFRQSGKIYVVITVIAIIFTGIISYLIYIDRKISNLENKQK